MVLTHKIICGDCIEVMKEMESNSVDLVVTSPPYDNLRDYKGYSFNFEDSAKELFRIIKEGGVIVWIVGDATIDGSETGTSFKQALYFKEIGFNLHDTMIYEKSGFSNPSDIRYHQVFEYMFVLSKGKPKTFNPIKDRLNTQFGWNKSSTSRQKTGETIKIKDKFIGRWGMRGNIWKYEIGYMKTTKDKIAYQHPAMFPERLAQDHVISWSNSNDIILDPFLGSGTTMVAAERLGRNSMGIEISKEYCEIAYKRLLNEVRQAKLDREPSIIERIGF